MAETTTQVAPKPTVKGNGEPQKAKKPRKKPDRSNPPVYTLLGTPKDDNEETVIRTFTSIGRARRWHEDSLDFIMRLYNNIRLLKSKEVSLTK